MYSLIILLNGFVHHVDFYNKDRCEAAKSAIAAEYRGYGLPRMVCVRQ